MELTRAAYQNRRSCVGAPRPRDARVDVAGEAVADRAEAGAGPEAGAEQVGGEPVDVAEGVAALARPGEAVLQGRGAQAAAGRGRLGVAVLEVYTAVRSRGGGVAGMKGRDAGVATVLPRQEEGGPRIRQLALHVGAQLLLGLVHPGDEDWWPG